MLTRQGRLRLNLDEFFELRVNLLLRIIPLSYEIALEVAWLGVGLRDLAARAIVATAFIESKLVPVVA